MPLIAYGINHQSTPISVREKLAFNSLQLNLALQTLIKHSAVEEVIILSTCHRTEIYANLSDYFPLQQWLRQQKSLTSYDLNAYDYAYHDIEAVKHIMRVASGLDSMILGEPQILGQLKQAYQSAQLSGTIGQRLQRLFKAVFKTSKFIRTYTEICAHPVSLAYVITQLLKTHYESLSDCRLLLVGAGETIQLIAAHLCKHNIQQVFIANRTLKNAENIVQALNAAAIPMEKIPHLLHKIDIVISATSSVTPVIHIDSVRAALTQDNHKLFFVDLGLPRNVDPTIASLNKVTLYNIDDLQKIIADNLQCRKQAAIQAENYIETYVAEFIKQERIHNAHSIISHFRNRLESIRDSELQKALYQLQSGHDPHKVMQKFGRSLINKIMHQPTIKLRTAASDLKTETLQAAKLLFELE